MTKISDLSALTGAGVDDAADLLPIVDMSETGAARNKKITIDETRIALGLSSTDSPQFTAVNLGHASDTTITRVSAGVVAIEGVNIVTTAGGITFAADIVVPDEAYDATNWNGNLEVPTKNAVRDKIESLSGGSFTAASTTEVLTGTDSAKGGTPDSIAALWEQGSDVASSGTISIGEGGYFNITGTTTITDIDFGTDKAGRKAWVKFGGILTLTHNASTLILPTGASITTAAGDTACFVSEGSDVVRCVAYNRASGAALAGGSGGSSPLATYTPSGASSVDITLPSGYVVHRIVCALITSVDGAEIRARFTADNFSTEISGASDYAYIDRRVGTTVAGTTDNAQDYIVINSTQDNVAGNHMIGTFDVVLASEAFSTEVRTSHGRYNASSDYAVAYGGGRLIATTTVNGIRFYPSSGTISGKAWVYGTLAA